MSIRLLLFTFAILVTACGGGTNEDSSPALAKPTIKTPIHIQSIIPYAKGNHIASNIKSECLLNTQLSEFIAKHAEENGMTIVRGKASSNAKGHVLLIEITDAISSGNAFIGHRKFVSIKGTLYKDGKKLAGFSGRRNSMGGFWGGFKGSCSVLGRTVEALGGDVARWLHSPVDGMHLGD